MIFGTYKRDGQLVSGLYDSWAEWNRETFSPECEQVFVTDFKTHGRTYADRKESARNIAVDYSLAEHGDLSYHELYMIQHAFEKTGRRYGLLAEFHENCIC